MGFAFGHENNASPPISALPGIEYKIAFPIPAVQPTGNVIFSAKLHLSDKNIETGSFSKYVSYTYFNLGR